MSFLLIGDLGHSDSAITNHVLRNNFLQNIRGSVIHGQCFIYDDMMSLFPWLSCRGIKMEKVAFQPSSDIEFISSFVAPLSQTKLLQISGCNIGDDRLCSLLHSCERTLTDLNIKNCSEIKELPTLSPLVNLENLSVRNCKRIGTDENLFGQAVKDCANLTKCVFTYCDRLSSTSVARITASCHKLTYLHVHDEHCLDTILSGFEGRVTNMQHLQLRGIWLHSVSAQIISKSMPLLSFLQLEVICGQESTLSYSDIVQILQRCPLIDQLGLMGFRTITDEMLVCIGQYLPALRQFSVSGEGLTQQGILSLTSQCSQLTVLILPVVSNLTDETIQTIGVHCRQLCTLHVNYCRELTDNAFSTLNPDTLVNLSVRGTNLTGSFLTYMPNLRHLYCDGCHKLDDSFFSALRGVKCLQYLSVQYFITFDWMRLSTLVPHLTYLNISFSSGFNQEIYCSFQQNAPNVEIVTSRRPQPRWS